MEISRFVPVKQLIIILIIFPMEKKLFIYLNICFTGGICTPKNKHAKESFLISYKPSQRTSRSKEKTFSIKS